MKTRVLSSLVGLMLLALVYVFIDTLLLNAAIALISIIAVYELLKATGCLQFRGLVFLAMLMTVSISFARARGVKPMLPEGIYVLIILYFILMLYYFGKMRIEHFAMTFLFSIVVPVFFSCAVFIRDDYGTARGGFYLLLALGAAWLCDTGAFFCGRAFGRHKLAPRVSPKKTVEGSVGGVIVCTALMLLLARGYGAVSEAFGTPLRIYYLRIALLTPVLAVMGMLGDLSMSAIKRQFNVKDFGTIMPGHGGVLDRFDSALFTLPAVYIVSRVVNLIAAA